MAFVGGDLLVHVFWVGVFYVGFGWEGGEGEVLGGLVLQEEEPGCA